MTETKLQSASVLAQEYQAYKKMQAKLWERFQGGFVLIKGTELKGVYPNEEMAVAKGREYYGSEAFLVKEIFAPGMEPVFFITRSFVQ